MSAKISACCKDCGEVFLTPGDVTLCVYDQEVHDPAVWEQRAYYEFDCPRCRVHWQFPADDLIRFLLVNAECPVRTIHVPQEVLETHGGPPIGYDDLLDLHEDLRNL